jgi:DNA (cytosine-5)-methyltransferase 1
MKDEKTKKTRYFSMFTGVGGFELGLENTGDKPNIQRRWEKDIRGTSHIQCKRDNTCNQEFRCVGFSEIDKYASELLSQKFPKVKNYGDATKINPKELPDFDILCGGFPCQAFSIAGKRRGFQDTRGTLFFDIARIIEVKRPQIVLLENVKGLLNHNKGETFRTIIQTLSELGYDVQWMVLNSKFFGVPQNRERVFIVGSIRGQPRPEILPFGKSNKGNEVKDYSATITSSYRKGCNNHNQLIIRGRPRYNEKGERNLKMYTYKDTCPTLSQNCASGDQKNMVKFDNMEIRRLTPTECERLQGFPDGWTEGFSDTQRYKMMGNAVTTNVINAIGMKLI